MTLASWAPYPQLFIFPLFLCAALLAGFGFWLEPDSSLAPRRALFWIWLVVALMGISEALVAGDAVTDGYRDIQNTVATATDDEARLRALFVRHEDRVEPFRQRDLDLAKALQQPRVLPDVASVASAVPMRFFLYLLPAVVFLLVYARFIYAGYHFFSRHSIEAAGGEALRTGALSDHEYELYLAIENIDHTRTKVKSPQTNGICERFHKTVFEEFHRVAFRKKLYASIEALQLDLDGWIRVYNRALEHPSGYVIEGNRLCWPGCDPVGYLGF